MEKITVDEGKAFDFGKTSKAYAKYRDIYPEEVFSKLHEIGVGVQGSRWLDLDCMRSESACKAADGWIWAREPV